MKKTKNKIYFIISAILLISIIMIKPNNAVSYSTGIIEMETDKNEIEIGGTFTISVLVKPGTTQRSITSTNAVLTYNSDVVQCIKTNQAYNERTGNIELKNEDGKISYSYDANAVYALGNTKLFTATFKVISYGKIQMNLVYNSKEGNRGEILNNQRRTVNIKLNVKLENIELNENEITIEKGCQRKLIVKYKPEETTDNKTIIWSSSNENVATVNQDGTVCAVSEGKCIVTAECNGKKAECEVYVCKKKIELKSIDIGKDITLEKEATYQLKIKYNPENTTESKSAIYESSNSHIAIVDDTGKIVAKNEGIAYITVKVNNLSSMIKVTVYTRNDKEDSSKNNMASNKNNRNNSNVNNIKNNVSNLEENIERETNSILQNQEQNNNVENELAENQINNNTQEVSANIVETSKPNYTWIVVIIVMGIIIIIFLFVYLKLSRSKH